MTQDEAITRANYLLEKLLLLQPRVNDKYRYYNADNSYRDLGIAVPAKMRNIKPGIGWAKRAVDTLSDRVVFDGFAGDTYGINNTLDDINGVNILNKAKKDAHIAGVSFVAIAQEKGVTKLVPFNAQEATGVIDQTTGLLEYGLAVTRYFDELVNQKLAPRDYILFTEDYTAIFVNGNLTEIKRNPTKRCLLIPVTHKASIDQPLGKSIISSTVRRIIQEVGRVKRRYEIAGEFYSAPQRYILGTEQDITQEQKQKLDSLIGKTWVFSKDDDGDAPTIGQLQQMNIDQFEGNKKGLARDFCAETGLTLRNLGYETGNPTSAESLAVMSDDLLLEAQNSQREMGEQFKQIAITLRMFMDNNDNTPTGLKELEPAWQPIFQVDIGSAGDAIYKLFKAMPELAGTIESYRMLGIGVRQAEELKQARDVSNVANFMVGGIE